MADFYAWVVWRQQRAGHERPCPSENPANRLYPVGANTDSVGKIIWRSPANLAPLFVPGSKTGDLRYAA